MLVQYHDRFDVVAEFEPRSGQLRLKPRPAALAPTATDGWFSMLSGMCVVFYRQANRLWLRIGQRIFDLDGDASVDWQSESGTAVFRAIDSAGPVTLTYPAGPDLGPDPTPFVADEDSDLGLFVANVLFDEERSELVRSGTS